MKKGEEPEGENAGEVGENGALDEVGEKGSAPAGANGGSDEGNVAKAVVGVIVPAVELELESETTTVDSRCPPPTTASCGDTEMSRAVRNDVSPEEEEFEFEYEFE